MPMQSREDITLAKERTAPLRKPNPMSQLGHERRISSFSGLLTHVEIGRIRIRSARKGRIRSLDQARRRATGCNLAARE